MEFVGAGLFSPEHKIESVSVIPMTGDQSDLFQGLLNECELDASKLSELVDGDEVREGELHPLVTQAEDERIDAEETLSVSVFEDELLQNEIPEVQL